MEIDLVSLKAKLKEVGQEHILAFWDELENNEKEYFAKQIENMDFMQIKELYEKSKKDEAFKIEDITPIPYINSLKMQNKEKYIKIGENAIRKEEVAVISMAGGQRNKVTAIMDQRQPLSLI